MMAIGSPLKNAEIFISPVKRFGKGLCPIISIIDGIAEVYLLILLTLF